MAVITYSNTLHHTRTTLANDAASLLDHIHLRPCMVVSSSMILAGLGIPFLVLLEMLALTLLLFAISLALIAAGVVLSLFYCGEI